MAESCPMIVSGPEQYKVVRKLGSGSFGVVTLCHKFSTNQKVALKIVNLTQILDVPTKEAAMLRLLMKNGGPRYHIVQWFGSFEFRDYFVHEFEALDTCLVDYLNAKGPLPLHHIRPILYQMGIALSFLKHLGIVHADLKHDNVMMVDRISRPLQIKIIDFGLARHVADIVPSSSAQTRPYRAPEVFLGAPYDQAIDMWSIGVIIAELHLGRLLFPGKDDNETFCNMIRTVGLPSGDLLWTGLFTYTHLIFWQNCWYFTELESLAPTTTNLHNVLNLRNTLKSTRLSEEEKKERIFFLNLVLQMLKPNPAERISPERLMQHPFMTMQHLSTLMCTTKYAWECQNVMSAVLRDILRDHQRSEEHASSSEEKATGPSEEEQREPSHPNKSSRDDQNTTPAVRRREAEVNLHDDPDKKVKVPLVPPKPQRQENSIIDLTSDSDETADITAPVRPKKRHREVVVIDLTRSSDTKPLPHSEPEQKPWKRRRTQSSAPT